MIRTRVRPRSRHSRSSERLLASGQQQERLIDALLTLARSETGLSSRESFELSSVSDTVLLSPGLGTGTTEVRVRAETGPAIPAAGIGRLFQPFQRLTPSRSSRQGGTGLGLAIVKAVADAHDATITATPQPHGGLRIEVSFPAPDRHGGQHTRQHQRAGPPVPSRNGQPSSHAGTAPRHHEAAAQQTASSR